MSTAAAEIAAPRLEPGGDSIQFPEGLPGWPAAARWELLSHPEAAPLLWLRSRETKGVALVVMDPRPLIADFPPPFSRETLHRIDLRPGDEALVLVVVTPGGTPEETTVNLRAPIVVNPRTLLGVQVILEGSRLPLAQPLMSP